MGKSALEIRMDYSRAMKQAESLLQIAADLRKTANSGMEECTSQIASCWEGNNATAYIQKCNQLKSNIQKTAASLETAANTVKQMAQNTYNAEMQALEIAMIRKY